MSRGRQRERAAEYFKRAPNYSGEALVALSRFSRDIKTEYVRTKHYVDHMIEVLQSSHKFTVPNDGAIFDHRVTTDMAESVRLPYPSIAVEFDCTPPRDSTPPDEALPNGDMFAPKRIAIAEKVTWGGTAGILVMACAFILKNGWLPDEFGFFFSTEKTDSFELGAAQVLPMGEIGDRTVANIGKDAADKRAFSTNAPEVRAIFQLCAALACTNVSTKVIRPSREAQETRPASPLFDYHVLMIQPGAERKPSEDRGGTHASPRTHLRRGHIRRLAWGPRIWVNSCVVAPGAIGTVNKDYAVKGTR